MSSPMEPYSGLFVLQAQETLTEVNSLYEALHPVRQLSQLFEHQAGLLSLDTIKNAKGETLEGHIKFTHHLPFRLFAIPHSPSTAS